MQMPFNKRICLNNSKSDEWNGIYQTMRQFIPCCDAIVYNDVNMYVVYM